MKKLTFILLLASIWIQLGHAQDAPKPPTLPMDRTVTDSSGRTVELTVLSKLSNSIKVRRKSDQKEFEIPLDKLSSADRTWAGSIQVVEPIPIEFRKDGKNDTYRCVLVPYGRQVILRIHKRIYAIEIHLKSNEDMEDVAYTIQRMTTTGVPQKISEGRAFEGNGTYVKDADIVCRDFQIGWSSYSEKFGYLYMEELPKGTEFYHDSLPSLNEIQTLTDQKSQQNSAKWTMVKD